MSLLRASDAAAYFQVRGNRRYQVTLAFEPEGMVAACDCPFLESHHSACKHVWAAILEAEHRGVLPDGEQFQYLEVVSADDLFTGIVRPCAEAEVLGLARGAPARRVDRGRTCGEPSGHPGGRRADLCREPPRGGTGLGFAVSTLARSRRMNGDWSKPRRVDLTPAQLRGLPSAQDRRILGLLQGAGGGLDPWSYGSFWETQRLPNPARIQNEAADVIYRELCASDRFFLAGRDGGLEPLSWDEGEA